MGFYVVLAGMVARDVYINWDYRSVLKAIEKKDIPAVEKYLAAKIDNIARYNNDLLRTAVQKDFVHAVKLLLGYEAVSDSLKNDNSCLFLAMEYGYEDIVLEMVRYPGIKDSLKLDKKVWEKIFAIEKITPIMVAAILETEENDVTSKISERDYQLVMLAAKAGRFDILTLFLDYAGIKDAVIANYAEAILEASTEGKNEGVVLYVTKMLISKVDNEVLLRMIMRVNSPIAMREVLNKHYFLNIFLENNSQLLQQYISDCADDKVSSFERSWAVAKRAHRENQEYMSRKPVTSDYSVYLYNEDGSSRDYDSPNPHDSWDFFRDYSLSYKHKDWTWNEANKLRPAVKDVIHECLRHPEVVNSVLANVGLFLAPQSNASMPELTEIRNIAFPRNW